MTGDFYICRDKKLPLFEIDLLEADQQELQEISDRTGVGLSLADLMAVRRHFRKQKRNPTDVELQTIGQTWSEHCFHRTFKGRVQFKDKSIESVFETFILRATEEINATWCVSVFEDNAGIIHFDNDHGIAAKVETHNHPSAIEPFGGAATGVGGVIRDVLGVWAEPVACTDVLGFGPLDYDYRRLPQGIKHPRYIYTGVVAGIGHYGNNMGIPTVNGAVYFDDSYVGNVVVYCGCVGILPLDRYKREGKPGHQLILVGGKTGRDGVHGVTFASAELTEESESVSRPAVQIANPIEEEKLKRAIIRTRDLDLASAITDLGGGGLSSAIGETARRFNCGANVHLEKVPLKYPGIAPWEIYVSESQERMLLIAPPENLEHILEIFEKEEVHATPIGELTNDGTLRIYHEGRKVAELDIPFLFQPEIVLRSAKHYPTNPPEPELSAPESLREILLQLLASPNIASKESIIRTYDHEVKGNTALKPLQGVHSGSNDAAIIKPLESSWKGLVISCGMNPKYGKIDTYHMAASAIDEAVRNNVAVGGRRIALLDNFTWGNPEKPRTLGGLVRACQACYDIATALQTPFISGKDSLYNESPLGPVTPTLLITALGVIPDIRCAVSLDWKKTGNAVYMIGETFRELGGSEYYRLRGHLGSSVPVVRPRNAKRIFEKMQQAVDSKMVKACHDLSEGGLGVAAAEMTIAGGYGVEIDLRKIQGTPTDRDDFVLFSESNTRFLVEISEDKKLEFEGLMDGSTCRRIGTVTKTADLLVTGIQGEAIIDVPVSDLSAAWKLTFGGRKRP